MSSTAKLHTGRAAGIKPYNHFMIAMNHAMSPDRPTHIGSTITSPANNVNPRPQTAF